MDGIGLLLKRLRKERALSQEKLAELSGIDRAYISQLEGRRASGSITLPTARALAKGLGVPAEVFLKDIDEWHASPTQLLSDVEVSIKAYIPVYAEVSAGEGTEPIDYVASTRMKAAPESLRAYRVKGLCLEPEIKDGDTVIVDTALQPQSSDLVVCLINGQACIKRFKQSDCKKYLENKDGEYQPENCYLHGVVTEVNRKLR